MFTSIAPFQVFPVHFFKFWSFIEKAFFSWKKKKICLRGLKWFKTAEIYIKRKCLVGVPSCNLQFGGTLDNFKNVCKCSDSSEFQVIEQIFCTHTYWKFSVFSLSESVKGFFFIEFFYGLHDFRYWIWEISMDTFRFWTKFHT